MNETIVGNMSSCVLIDPVPWALSSLTSDLHITTYYDNPVDKMTDISFYVIPQINGE